MLIRNELACSVEDCLAAVSRWAYLCMMINQFYQWVESPLMNIVSTFIGQPVRLYLINIISKSACSDLSVPCHQDISYSREDPYEFSLWLALLDVRSFDGVLEFLPYSQKEKIEPAIDFWFPYFLDNRHLSLRWQKKSISVLVRAGDVIEFDSRTWHRSAQNTSGKNRFVLVTRWSKTNYQLSIINYQLSVEITEKRP